LILIDPWIKTINSIELSIGVGFILYLPTIKRIRLKLS